MYILYSEPISIQTSYICSIQQPMWLVDSAVANQSQKKEYPWACNLLLLKKKFIPQTRNSLRNTLNKISYYHCHFTKALLPLKPHYSKPSNHIKDIRYENNSLLNSSSQFHLVSYQNKL